MSVQIGINTWTWTAPFTTAEARTLFPKIRTMGYDIVEFPLEDPSLVNGGDLRLLLQDNGLNATVCGAFGPGRDLGHEDPQITRQSLDYIHTCLQICQDAGARLFVGPMYSEVGKARQLPPDERRQEFDRAASGLKQAAVMAADHGVTLGIEPLNRFETDMINTAAQAIALTDAIDHPSAQIHLDTFHMNIEEDSIYEAIRAVGSRLCHIHACENHRGTPGKGLVQWDQLQRGLREVGYAGPVVIETFTPTVKEIARAAAIWRPLRPLPQDQLATDGLRFLRELLA